MTRDEKIAQWFGLWERQKCRKGIAGAARDGIDFRCACGFLYGRDRSVLIQSPHGIPCPDLTTPDGIAKVKAALVAREIEFLVGYPAHFREQHSWYAVVRGVSKCADTEAEALLAAIAALIEAK